MSDDIHEIYAIKYGHHDRQAAENYIGGDPHDVNEPLDFFVWAIVGPSGTIVVDTGFDAAMAKKRNRALSKPIAEGLKSIDIAPDKVANVIVTHLHYDHTGNYECFPNARYPPAGHRDGLRDRPLHVPPHSAPAVRGGGRGGDGAQGVRRAASRSTTASARSRPASRCTRSAGTRRACNASA